MLSSLLLRLEVYIPNNNNTWLCVKLMKTISVFITHNQSYLKLVRQKQEERWRKRNIYEERKREIEKERERKKKELHTDRQTD